MYDIQITQKINGQVIANGYVITIGCRTFITTDIKKALKNIGDYIDDPVKTEEKFAKKYPQEVASPTLTVSDGFTFGEAVITTGGM